MSSAGSGVEVGRRIRLQRNLRGVSLRELAARVGVSAATLSAIENGHTRLSVERLHRIATELGVVPQRLLDQVEDVRVPASPAVDDDPELRDHRRPLPELPGQSEGLWREFPELPLDPATRGALIAFCDKGFHGASIRDIAERAGLSVAGLYHYHSSKQSMLPLLLDLTMADLGWRLDVARAEAVGDRERLHRTVECLALFHARRPRLAFIGASEMRSLHGADRTRITLERKRVQGVLSDDIRAVLGQRSEAERLVVTLGNAISTMCTSLSQWIHHDGSISPEQIAIDYADAAVAMVTSTAPGKGPR